MSLQYFDESRFRRQVDSALQRIRTVLDITRAPQYPADVPHAYDDKYGLAEFLTNTAIAAELNVLDLLGVTDKHLSTMRKWVQSRSVTLRLKSEERCSFIKETTREVESATKYVTEYSDNANNTASVTRKVVTTITEYFWKFTVDYELFAFQGNDVSDKVTLQSRKGTFEIVTTTKTTPKPEANVIPSIDLNLSWLLQNINDQHLPAFSIKRDVSTCHTPRRNADVDRAFSFFRSAHDFSGKVRNYFMNQLFPVQSNHGLNLNAINDSSLFVPVVPLFEAHKASTSAVTAPSPSSSTSLSSFVPSIIMDSLKKKDKKEKKDKKDKKDKDNNNNNSKESPRGESTELATSSSAITAPKQPSPVLPVGDVNAFLSEQKRSFSEKFDELAKQFPDGGKLITVAEANLIVVVLHAMTLAQVYHDGVDYIELMLRRQLVAAIGKEVSSVDFTNYMRFHNRKLFKAIYQPQPFSYNVARPQHYPEGVVSIEAKLDDGSVSEPIPTITRKVTPAHPMHFSINAATKVTFGGDRYVHAYVAHQFAGYSGTALNLVARARQFSSFMLLVGRIVSATEFEPKHAIIIQNKDEVIIPLLLEQLPTPKEFRDAIESLSPEQQEFCRAFRAMQLESSLFGICIIQLKPQLEKLLKLPDDSLTKEIKMTQELLELFIKYQIPSDLLSYDGSVDAPASTKVSAVKGFVANMYDMINASKEKELIEVHQEALYAAPQAIYESDMLAAPMPVMRRMSRGGPPPPPPVASAAYFSGPPPPPPSAAPMPRMAMQMAPMAMSAAPTLSARTSSIAPGGAVVAKQIVQPAPTPAPTTAAATPTTPTTAPVTGGEDDSEPKVAVDFTKIPTELDKKFGELDEDSALRPTIINPGTEWTKRFQKALLATPSSTTLGTTDLEQERNKAFDLLDALSRSGSLTIDQAELHVVLAATHCFDKSLMDTVIQDNINPIVKVERSALIVATTIQGKPASELVKGEQQHRLETTLPKLFLTEA